MNLKEYLNINNISQAQFARDLKIHKSHMYMIIRNERRPSVELASEIIRLTGGKVTLEELLIPRNRKNKSQEQI